MIVGEGKEKKNGMVFVQGSSLLNNVLSPMS